MDLNAIFDALLLGLIEGLTEFIPVSSTGHLLLAGHCLGFNSPGKTFEVLIQLGAILAILSVYFHRLVKIGVALPHDARSRRFVFGVFLAFLPAAVVGALGHDIIKQVFFESPKLVCTMLLVGGVVLFMVDRMEFKPRYTDVMDYPLWLCFVIGLFQCFALIPGTSRSGSTIVGSLLFGTDKRSATEFTFFLAIPTMAGAFVFDLYKNRHLITFDDGALIAIGFVAAFVSAVFVVRHLLDYVSRHGFRLFVWWRIIVGAAGLAALLVWG
jgi:undecaprenyl-diphosphatase